MAPKAHDPAQLALIDPETGKPKPRPGRRRTGRHERALEAAVKDQKEQLDKPIMAAAVSLARALAAGLDAAELAGKGYETSQLAGQYRDQLRALGLMPDVGGASGAADPLDFGGAE